MTPSLLELCDHARRSCMVNGLIPKEWRWGMDMIGLYDKENPSPFMWVNMSYQFPFMRFQGLPVFPMRTDGVACIGKKPYISLLNKTETK